MDSTMDHIMSENIMNDSMGREEGEKLLQELINEMNDQSFDAIKFASYRTAAKLLFIQKKTNLHLVDVYNMIESFRENGLNTLDHNTELHESRLEAIVSSIFYALNKRLPVTHNVDVERSIALVTNWLLCAYDGDAIGRIRVLSVKTALSTMCAGRLIDKLRYAFSQVEDDNGFLNFPKFEAYLKELLQLPAVVGEAPTFGFTESVVGSFFKPEGNLKRSETVLIDFLENVIAKDPPRCYVWLTTLQKIATAQKIQHQIECQVCKNKPIVGLRYKCLHCYNYTLCQDCFWRGKCSGRHTVSHDMREYSSWKTGESGSTFKSKFLCGARKKRPPLPEFPSEPEPNKTLDMTNIVPPMPTEFSTPNHTFDYIPSSPSPDSIDSSLVSQPAKHSEDFETRMDDEHKLICRYAARLAANARGKTPSKAGSQLSIDSNRESRELIQTLENKNRLLLKEIRRLRDEHDEASRSAAQIARNPELLAELKILRQRKDELELRMSALQESRRELMVQLEGLMNMLKAGSPRPSRSPKGERLAGSSSPELHISKPRHASDPGSSPGSQQSLSGVDGDIKQAFGEQDHTGTRNLRNDLLHAADSVTSAMSSLVKELNSGKDLEDNSNFTEKNGIVEDPELKTLELEVNKMTESLELDKRIRHKASDNLTNGDVTNNGAAAVIVHAPYKKPKHQNDSFDSLPRGGHVTDDESYIQTDDDEGTIRTDDEELEWQESMKRWANR